MQRAVTHRIRRYGTTTVSGQKLGVVAAAWSCTAGPGILTLSLHPPDSPRDQVVDLTMRARCLNAGEKPPDLPRYVEDASSGAAPSR
jgi:hypothetical protein